MADFGRAYKQLIEAITEALHRHDFVHIAYVRDEYEPEARTIAARLREATSAVDVRRIMREEFVHWFSEEDAGPEERYQEAAEEIWRLWQTFPKGNLENPDKGAIGK